MGRVQGVFFRAATQREAQRLGVGGWVRNLANGDVEVFVCGATESVGSLIEWLHRGPPQARVRAVNLQEIDDPELTDFRITS